MKQTRPGQLALASRPEPGYVNQIDKSHHISYTAIVQTIITIYQRPPAAPNLINLPQTHFWTPPSQSNLTQLLRCRIYFGGDALANPVPALGG